MARRAAGPRLGALARRLPTIDHQRPGERADPHPRAAAPLVPVVPVFGDGRFPTQPVWVEDVALAFALSVEQPSLSGVFELGGPQVLTYEEFLLAIGRAAGHPRPLVHMPLALARAAAGAFDLLGAAAPLTSDQLQMLVEGSATPANAIESVFGIRPIPFEQGLNRYLAPGRR